MQIIYIITAIVVLLILYLGSLMYKDNKPMKKVKFNTKVTYIPDKPLSKKHYRYYNNELHNKSIKGEIYKHTDKNKIYTHSVDDHEPLYYGIKN